MKNQMVQKVEDFLKEMEKKPIRINQLGFIVSQFYISELIYIIKDDILNLRDSEGHEFISINLNQVYKLEVGKNKLTLYLDNDSKMKIEMMDNPHLI